MTNLRPISWLQRVFPALRRVGRRLRGRQIPFVQQMETADCGAACLAMVLGYYGKDVPLGQVREATGTTSRDGVTAFDIKEAARRYGLRCRAVYVKGIDELAALETASILHYGPNHFVVFERLRKKAVDILDPAPTRGRRRIPIDEIDNKYLSGTVLMFEPAEDFRVVRGDRTGVWPYLKQVISHSGVLTRILVTSLLIQVFALALPLLTKVLIDRAGGDYDLLTVLGVGLVAIVLFHFLMSIVRAHLLLELRTRLDVQLTLSFVEHLINLPYAFFQKRSTGDLVMRLNSNATIREVVTSGVLAGFLDGTLVVFYFAIFFLTSPFMAWIVVVLALLQVGLFVLSYRRYMDLMTEELGRQAEAQGYEVQMLAGIETLKAAGAEYRASEYWSDLFVDVLNVMLKRGRLSALVESLLSALRMASPLLILWVGAFRVLTGEMSLGTMFAINALAGGLLIPLSSVVSIALQFSTVKSFIERIKDVMETSPEQDIVEQDIVETPHKHKAQSKPRKHTLQGQVALEGVSFRYGPPHRPMVVKDVSIRVEPGQQVAIVGRSGSGKSTLARLLISLHTPMEGRVLYDGVDLAELDYRSIRRQVGFVPQNPYLFGTTIRANIALANPELSPEAVEEAARLAHIHDFITDRKKMPMGYETPLADRGASLSGGERQRIALARALAQKPIILVLDEATSEMDAATESVIQGKLESLACTRIVIAHRLNTIVNADFILVMKDGTLCEQGTHEKLLALRGEYWELFSAQVNRESHEK